jgi:hypothetical protein
MAKKKQLAGKKTKLADLPLTQALAGQVEEAAPGEPTLAAPVSQPHQAPAPGTPAAPLATAYLELVQELADLRTQLGPDGMLPFPEIASLTIPRAQPLQVQRVLALARKALEDLHRLLSRK